MSNSFDLVKSFPIFSSLSQDEIQQVLAISEELTAKDGAVLFAESDRSNKVFVIVDGRVDLEMHRVDLDDGRSVATLTKGDMFGESTLLGKKHRTATAVAHGDVSLVVWEGDVLLDFFEKKPRIGYHVALNMGRELADRLESADLMLRYS